MSDNIPHDLMTNIFQRLSVKDLVRCKGVSKQWLSIIDTPHFISSQLHRSVTTNSNVALLLQDLEGPILYRKEENPQVILPLSSLIHLRRQPDSQYPDDHRLLLIGSCHGLICFTIPNNVNIELHDLVVLNPSTGDRHVVSSFITKEEANQLAAYGFGYDECTDDYKVVIIMELAYLSCEAIVYHVRGKCFSSDVTILENVCWTNTDKRAGVFAHGSLHWCNTTWAHLCIEACSILAVDLGSEIFRELEYPNFQIPRFGPKLMGIGVVDSCLWLTTFDNNVGEIEIWVMKEYGNNSDESWNKIHSIQYGTRRHLYYVKPVGSYGGRVLMLLGWHGIVWYEPGKKSAGEALSFVNTSLGEGFFEAIFCLESLVKVMSDNGGLLQDRLSRISLN